MYESNVSLTFSLQRANKFCEVQYFLTRKWKVKLNVVMEEQKIKEFRAEENLS